jgi:hypothetical protein
MDTVSLDTLCTDTGTIAFERERHACGGSATVTVVDCGPNESDGAVDTVEVLVSSDSEPTGELALLAETGPNTSRFTGSVPLATANSAGVLQVTEGDVLSALYVDAEDGMGNFDVFVTDAALVDCTPPDVLAVTLSHVTATGARVTVDADEPIGAAAFYGLSCASTPESSASEGLATTAVVDLVGLQPDTTYFVKVLATDEAGNTTLDANGGACHAFTTDDAPNSFTEEFLGDNDLDGLALFLTPTTDADGYRLCTRPAGGLYVDPAGGTKVTLSDDGSALVSLAGGQTVTLYGTSHASFYVIANGNLTFGAADGTSTESLAQHFAVRRVAALFDDLNPAAGGAVSRKQLSDRVAVTWQDVPEYGTSNQSSFQIELFFDGRIRITYLTVAATDGIAGLSRGVGLDPSFLETDLSGAPPCGSMPPAAAAGTPSGMATASHP